MCEERGFGNMKHPQAIFLCLTSLTAGEEGGKKRREVAFYAVNFAAVSTRAVEGGCVCACVGGSE